MRYDYDDRFPRQRPRSEREGDYGPRRVDAPRAERAQRDVRRETQRDARQDVRRSTQRVRVSQDGPVRRPQDGYGYEPYGYEGRRERGYEGRREARYEERYDSRYDARRPNSRLLQEGRSRRQDSAARGYRDARDARSYRDRGARAAAPSHRPPLGHGYTAQELSWLRLAVGVVVLLVALALVVNLASCIAGVLAPAPSDEQASLSSAAQQEEAPGESSSSASSASDAQETPAEGVESPWTASGYFSTGDAELDAYVKGVCDRHSTAGASFEENAYATNLYISQTDYIERASNQSPYGVGWDVEYAKQYFEKGYSGNCYNFCAVTQFVLRYFGYEDAEAQPCVVHLQSGDWGDHGLVFVTNKASGQRCLVDDALSANGWMLDIDAYDYDVRNIAQNATVKGNVDALDDDDEPRRIEPGALTPGYEND